MVATTSIKISVPEDDIKTATPTPNMLVQKNTKINMLITTGKISKKLQTGLMKRQRQEHIYLFSALFCITILIPILALLQHGFMKSVEKELLSIKKMDYPYPTETIPSVTLDDVELSIVHGKMLDDVSNSQLNNFFESIDASSTGMPNDAMKGAAEVITTVEEETMKPLDGIGARMEIASMEQHTFGHNGLEESEEVIPSTIIPEVADLESEEYHVHEQSDKTIDYMKVDIIFKMYAYIYAFYVSIIFLMVIQFIIVVRLHSG